MLRSRKTATAVLAAAVGVLLAVAGCSSRGGAQAQSGGAAEGQSYTIAMITHEAPGSAFWDRVRSGAEQAARDLNVDLKYSNDPAGSNQATFVQNAVDSKVAGIAVTYAYPDQVGPATEKAAQAGIPVVAFNAGMNVYKDYGASMFFGSDEDLAGQSAGTRIAQEGGTKVLCVVHEQGNISLETRCGGVAKSFPGTETLQVNGSDLPSVQQTISAKLQQDPSISNVVTLDAGIASAALAAKESTSSRAKIETFDLSPDVVTGIKEEKIDFSVDQQPYLQGYLAVQALWLNLTNGNDIGGGRPVLTGPSYVDSSNIDKVADYAARNTR
ncbi:substrate-binding domain-containing protein [Pseudonocardia halophobica]|uniref:Sugar ABC transporter substrate-binding protein n=1 Tax=Pseudonocardia halophobica TaxID=29401 RepID=A0A9W6NWZ5_9PSEU|nr:substrate-binding domain-containing protein [Pseudonocardia halophobica]GLL11997.1 sugar ABC transporter substrate-binding protein [Pseudonocardia halophobica]